MTVAMASPFLLSLLVAPLVHCWNDGKLMISIIYQMQRYRRTVWEEGGEVYKMKLIAFRDCWRLNVWQVKSYS